MPAELARRSLSDHRRSFLFWVLGVGCYVVLIVVVWPTVRDSAQLSQAFADYPDTLKELFGGEASFDFTTSAGYLNAELFSLMYPLFLSIFAIALAASTLAGEEEHGQLDLVLAYPVRRTRVVTEKAAAVGVAIVGLAGSTGLTMYLVGLAVDLDTPAGNLAAAVVGSALVAAVMGGVTLLAGAASGRRAVAVGAGAGVFGAAYLLQVLGAFVDSLGSARWLSPIHLANGRTPVRDGWPWLELGVLVLVVVVLTAAARWVFAHRDLDG